MNRIFNGTGVCFSLEPAGLINHGGGGKFVVLNVCLDCGLFFCTSFLKPAGTLKNCIESVANQQGSLSKITLYNGIVLEKDVLGRAFGANEILGDDPGYDICGKWANTVMLAPGAVTDVFNTMAHEVGHLLGLRHTKDTKDLMYEFTSLDKRLSSAEAAMAYKIACEILAGDC